VAEGADKLQAFGLTTPKFVVKLTLADGKDVVLNVGDESSYDQSLFFTKGDEKKVYVAESGLRYPLDKGLFDLRDKAIVTHEDKDVQGFAVTGNGVAWAVERDGDGWKLISPIQDKADKSTVDGILSKIRSARAKSFPLEQAPKDAAELAKYGFDKPTAEIIFGIGADKAKKTLQITSVEDGGVKKGYARLVEGGPVAEVEATLGHDLLKPVADLRDKTLTTFDREKLTKLEIDPAGGEKLVLTKNRQKAADGGLDDTQFALEGKTEPVKKDKFIQAFGVLNSLKALAIADDSATDLAKYGLDKPQFTITAYDGAQEAAKLLVGSVTGSRYYVQKSGNPRVYEVEKGTLDQIPRKAEDYLQAPTPPPAPPATANTGAPAGNP